MSVQKEQQELFDISKPRFDLSTYAGRVANFYSTTSPLTLFYSNDALLEAQKTAQKYDERIKEAGKKGYYVNAEQKAAYDKAKQLVNSSIHPDTHEPIALPFRMSAFVPTNLIIVAGMLIPNPGLISIIGTQWANQSLNVGVNLANSNKSIQMSNQEIGIAYMAATATSVGLAVGLTKAVPRLPVSQGMRSVLARLVPFVSVASAGVVNISCIRWKEMREGVQVFRLKHDDAKGHEEIEVVGKSSEAGKRAVGQSAASRVLTNIPTLVLPPVLMSLLEKRGTFVGPRGKLLSTATQLTLIGLCLGLALPPAIGYFPQRAAVDPDQLEEQFHHYREKLYFNKGL